MEGGIVVEGKVVVGVISGLLSFANFVTKDVLEAGIMTGGAADEEGDMKEKLVLGNWLVAIKLLFSEVEAAEVGPDTLAADEYGGGFPSPNNEVEEDCLLIDDGATTTGGGLKLVVEADENIDLIFAASAEEIVVVAIELPIAVESVGVIKFVLVTAGTSAFAKALPVGLDTLMGPKDDEDSGVDSLKGMLLTGLLDVMVLGSDSTVDFAGGIKLKLLIICWPLMALAF